MKRLEGKTALITGAARGLGKAMAEAFAKEGAKVVITDIDGEQLNKTAAEIAKTNENILALMQDVTKPEDWQRVIKKSTEFFGGVHILVNNAGYLPKGGVEDAALDEMKRSFDVLVHGVFLGMKIIIPEMKKSQVPCAILNVSSVCGAYVATENHIAYNTAKSAILGMTRAAAVDLAGSNVRVNAIHPGSIQTELSANDLQGKIGKIKLSKIPLGRTGRPEEVAMAALFLCSDEASYIHGTSLVVDGGQILGYRDPNSF